MIANFSGGAVASQRRDAERERITNNSAQVVTHYHRHITTGVGRERVAAPVVFDLPFLVEPSFTSGMAIIAADATGAFHDPEGGASVRAWTTDEQGHYTGALISVYVRCEAVEAAGPGGADELGPPGPAPTPAGVRCAHTLAFAAPAYKRLESGAQLALETTIARTPGY